MTAPVSTAPDERAPLSVWLDWMLTSHPSEIQMGLERVAAVADRMGLRQAPPLTFIIGGTNGKGAATTLLAKALRLAGYRVGTYTSPHLHRYAERICIDGTPVPDAAIVAAFQEIERVRGTVPLTYFEFGTLAALQVFRAEGVEVQVLEVGLGGRLDAVNMLDADGALITSIGLDHCDYLGPTRESVAAEKGGIYRPGAPAICTDTDPPSSWLAALAAQGIAVQHFDAPLRLTEGRGHWSLQTSPGRPNHQYSDAPLMPGTHQKRNAAGVFALLDALEGRVTVSQAVRATALAHWCLAGRFERRGAVWLDVAHNAEAFAALRPLLETLPRPRHAVLGMLADKPVERVAKVIAGVFDAVETVSLETGRGLSAETLAGRLAGSIAVRGCHADMRDALAAATVGAAATFVGGSIHTVAAARAVLGG